MRILFVSPGVMGRHRGTGRLASFQQADVDLFDSLGYEVRQLLWSGRPIGGLMSGARWADVVYCWSISDHAFVASIVGRKLACVVGGYEFADLPEVHYGNMLTRRMRFVTKWVWKRADALLYVDPSLMDEATKAFGGPGRAFYVPTGYAPDYWTPNGSKQAGMVLTVCHVVPALDRIRLKGVDLFIEVARRMPDFQFHIAGEAEREQFEWRSIRDDHGGIRWIREPLPGNVVLHQWLERDGLRDLYRRAEVYCQLSLHEGLPNAVCEAMLCGCVPVGTAVNGIPTAIGDAGYIVSRDPSIVATAVRRAASDLVARSRARERIVKLFPVERRKQELSGILERLIT